MDSTRVTVVGVFEDRAAAEAALQDLRTHGFADEDIGYAIRSTTTVTTATPVSASGSTGTGAPTGPTSVPGIPGATAAASPTSGTDSTPDPMDLAPEETGAGAATGAITGGVLGGLIGVAAALLVPGIGPVIAGGILASALGGAAIGAAAGGLLGALVGLGVPEEEARLYEGDLQAGRAVVTVHAEHRYPEAHAILQRHGAANLRSAPSATADEPMTLT
jgi:hypothetical protein